MTRAKSSRITGPWVNVASPESTQEDAEDLELSKWAALQLHKLKTREIGRGHIDQELAMIPEEKINRAKHWLNHYRGKKEN